MERRTFIKYSSAFLSTSSLFGISSYLKFPANLKNVIIGHGDFKYKVDIHWGALNPEHVPVKDCHEMVQDSQGRILLLTNHTKNNVIVYDKSGKLLETWGNSYPGAHGLTINNEGGEDFLYICDNSLHMLIKTDIKGKEIFRIPYPKETGLYESEEKYIPTESAIASNGDIYIADGYGEQYILQYDSEGGLKSYFGGRGEEEKNFDNAHGVTIDNRSDEEKLLITARAQNKLKKFSLGGELEEVIDLPGAFICRPVVKNKEVYLATIWSGDRAPNTGFISVLNAENKLVSAPGGNIPTYNAGKLSPMYQTLKVFNHPHDVCVDDDENLYVAQWNANQVYPFKLIRV